MGRVFVGGGECYPIGLHSHDPQLLVDTFETELLVIYSDAFNKFMG